MTTIAAGAILNIAFQELAKSGAVEIAKQTVGGTVSLAKGLRDKIISKFKGHKKAESAIAAVEAGNSLAALTKLEVCLDDAMADDAVFATELRQAAQKIINIQNHATSNRNYQNHGRDQINIERLEGNPKIGGS